MNLKTYVHRYVKIRNIKLSGMKQTRNGARTKIRAYKILQGKKKVREHLEELSVETMNFKTGPKKRVWEEVYWICLVQDKAQVQWWAFVVSNKNSYSRKYWVFLN
jgi:hypothetical protein